MGQTQWVELESGLKLENRPAILRHRLKASRIRIQDALEALNSGDIEGARAWLELAMERHSIFWVEREELTGLEARYAEEFQKEASTCEETG